MSTYPEYSIQQNYPLHSIIQSYNPQVGDQPRERLPNENPKDYMLSTYRGVELVFEVNAATAIYRMDPFVKYLCAWRTEVSQEEVGAIKLRTQWKHPNLLSFLFFDHSSPRQIRIFYEYLSLDVKQMIMKRFETKSYIPETELIKFLQGLSSVFSFLEKKGIHHGAIQIESVYFDEEYLLYRVQDVSPFRVKAPNLFQNIYPPPELQNTTHINKFKVDVFGLGIVTLSMMLLRDCGDLFQNETINQQTLRLYLEEASKIYSPKLCSQISQMVELNASLRADWQTLSQLLECSTTSQKSTFRSSSTQKPINPPVIIEETPTIPPMENRRNTETRVKSMQSSTQKGRSGKIDQKLLQLTNKIQETLAKSQNTQATQLRS